MVCCVNPGAQPLPPSHEPNSLAMPSGALGGMSVDQYQQDMTAMPPAKETESLTEFLPGFGVFLFRKDKHSRKRRRQFIKLGRSQKVSTLDSICTAPLISHRSVAVRSCMACFFRCLALSKEVSVLMFREF